MTEKRRFLTLFLLAFVPVVLFAAPVEIIQGNLKLILYPETGRFSLCTLSDVGKNRYEPLFDDRNSANTSSFSVLSNGRIFKLEKKSGKPVVFEREDQKGRFIFTLSDDFQVTQEFSFIAGTDSATPVGLQIDTTIENTSGKSGTFACKALVDTFLGESAGIHFRTDIRNRISSETVLDSTVDLDRFIVSAGDDKSLLFLVSGKNITVPAKTYAANWDRLNTLSWAPDYVAGRSFNTLYSVNDSALLFLWPENTLAANDTCRIRMILGPETPELESLGARVVESPGTKQTPGTEVTSAVAKEKNDLVTQIIARITEIKSNPDSASDDELAKLNATLDILLKPKKD